MSPSSQNSCRVRLILKRRTLIQVNRHLSYRCILNIRINKRAHNRCLRHTQATLCKTVTSRDPRSLNTTSMASEPRPATTKGNITPSDLPRFLRRPVPQPIQKDRLVDACPELKNVSPALLAKHLASKGYHMHAGLGCTKFVQDNSSELPSELSIEFTDPFRGIPPTHILALSTVDRPRISLYLIHQLPFAANCSNFPALPKSEMLSGKRPATAKIPVYRIVISEREAPSIEAFALFRMYVYIKNLQALRTAFLPKDWMESMDTILKAAVRVKGFWSIASAFGILDDGMFDVVEECWAEVLRVLEQLTTP